MVAVGLRNFHDDNFAFRVGHIRVLLIKAEARYHRATGIGSRVVDIEIAVLLVIGAEGKAKQAFFVAFPVDPIRNIQEYVRLLRIVDGKGMDDSTLFGDEYQAARIIRLDEIGHLLERQAGKHPFDLKTAARCGLRIAAQQTCQCHHPGDRDQHYCCVTNNLSHGSVTSSANKPTTRLNAPVLHIHPYSKPASLE